jgi:hypothetical protein
MDADQLKSHEIAMGARCKMDAGPLEFIEALRNIKGQNHMNPMESEGVHLAKCTEHILNPMSS